VIPVLIVPVLTRYELLDEMLSTIDYPIGHLVVIDNGDELDCVGSRHAQRVTLLNLPANLGVSGSWNLGIKATPFAPWWLIANFDVTWPAGSLSQFADVSQRDTLTLANAMPPWCAFTIGDRVVERVGLFDERLHPAYFEDNDMERRTLAAGFEVVYSDVPVNHKNSSTLQAGYRTLNDRTFSDNAVFYGEKQRTNDMSWGWSLDRRRELSWD